jgi:mannitol-1-/sugar-/sorbitol-6-/2-deoxyglucose-6-phosphatase
MKKAIIFDMDGLLVESESVWGIAEEAMLVERGMTTNVEARETLVGLRMDEFMTKMREIYSLKDTVDVLSEELIVRMLTLIPPSVKPQPGAQELLKFVAEQQIPCAIASSSPARIIDATVKAQGWEHIFSVRCSAEHEERGKPAPDVYLRAAEKLGVAPQDCLTLEDSPNGARAAIAAGMLCYAVPDLTHTRAAAFDGITPHVFASLHEVLAHVRANGVIISTNS